MKKILVFVSYYLPGYKAGGPIQSIANIVDYLGSNFQFHIVTNDRDSSDTMPYSNITIAKWQKIGKANVYYLPFHMQNLGRIAKIMRETEHDLIYINSFFHSRSSIIPLLAQKLKLAPKKPIIIAPRGEFSDGALSLKSAKKKMYIKFSKFMGLYQRVLWHASSEHESNDIKKVFGKSQNIYIASNLPRKVQKGLFHKPRNIGDPLRIIFLSRISPMKNLIFVLKTLSMVKVPINLTIIGNIASTNYWSKCQTLINNLPPYINVSYEGIIPSSEVPTVIAKYDLFFLPTLGENFGHAIIESLGAGTPVLISNNTPWQDLDKKKCGWVISLDKINLFIEIIEKMFHEPSKTSSQRRKEAINYATLFTESGKVIEENRNLFHLII